MDGSKWWCNRTVYLQYCRYTGLSYKVIPILEWPSLAENQSGKPHIFKYILEAKTHGRRFRGLIWEQNIAACNTNQTLVWFWWKTGFRWLSIALMRGVDAEPKHCLIAQRTFFPCLYPMKHLKGFQMQSVMNSSHSRNHIICYSVNLLYKAGTSIKELASSPTVFFKSILCSLWLTHKLLPFYPRKA